MQGTEAPADLCRALGEVNARGMADIIIIGRGGGSIEDLWAFNDEAVARAIYASKIPVVSAVGHEPDVTIADFVADLRAPTPSGAAELVTPDKAELYAFLQQVVTALQVGLRRAAETRTQRFQALNARFQLRSPQRLIEERRILLDHETERLCMRSPQYKIDRMRDNIANIREKSAVIIARKITVKQNALSEKIAALDAMSPLKVLTRGYAVALDSSGNAVRDSAALTHGDELKIRFARGSARCKVTETRDD